MIQLARCYESFKFIVKVKWECTAQGTPPRGGYTPVGGRSAHCARCTDANMQYLDGYTCQGTHSLMDGPQMKPCTSLGGSSCYSRQPRQHRQLDSVRQSRQLSTQRSAVPPSTVSTVSTVLSSCQARQLSTILRQLSTVVDSSTVRSTASTASTARAQACASRASQILGK